MNILFDIGHPGHVHLLRNLYFELIKDGHNVLVTTKDVEIIKVLLEKYLIPYISLGEKSDSLKGKLSNQLKYDAEVLKLVWKNNISIGVGTSITIAHVSKFTGMKSIVLDDDDDEVQPLFVKFAHPFADVVLSPSAVIGHRKTKHSVFYDGYHELAYLHPKRFSPDKKILDEVGIKENERFFIMRFNVFKAHHDVGVVGLSLEQKLRLVELLEKYGKVFITTEREPEPELKKYHLPVSAEKAHDLMAFATMFLGDSQTMTSEAAVLGVPALRCNSFAGRISYLEEEEHKYGLTYGFLPSEFEKMYEKAKELLDIQNLREEWQEKRRIMLSDKIDVTAFQTWFIENYPESKKIMRKNPDYQYNFK